MNMMSLNIYLKGKFVILFAVLVKSFNFLRLLLNQLMTMY